MISNNGTGPNALFDTANLGAFNGDYTVEFWTVIGAPTGGFECFWCVADATNALSLECFLAGDGISPFFDNATSGVFIDTAWPGGVVAAGQRIFWAISHTAGGTNQSTMYKGVGNGALASTTFADAQVTTIVNGILFDFFSLAEPLNANMASWCLRNAALTQREIENDYQRLRPWSRMSSVQRFHPLFNVADAVVDWSGNEFNWTTFGGALQAGTAFAPVPWSPPAVMMM